MQWKMKWKCRNCSPDVSVKIPSSPDIHDPGCQGLEASEEWPGLQPVGAEMLSWEEWICQAGKGWMLVLLQTPGCSFSIAQLICTGCGNYPRALESV